MGMRYEDFWFNYDLREFWNAVEGYYEAENRKLKESWEQTRTIVSVIANKPVYGYKNRPKVAKQLLPFPWDDETGSVPTDEELRQLREDTWQQER